MIPREIGEYIGKQRSPQKEILKKVRRIILKTLPGCEEKMAWGCVVFAGQRLYIAAMKDRVHVGFAITGLSKGETDLFEGTGRTMRHIKIRSLREIKEKKLAGLIRMAGKKAVCRPCKPSP